jgi:putative DNA primase/helicase
MRADVTKEVIGKWPNTLLELGIPEEFLTGKHGPCPMCGGKDRFRFTDYENAGLYICTSCGNGNGWKLLQNYHGWSFVDATKQVKSVLGITKNNLVDNPSYDPIPALKRMAKLAEPIQGYGSVPNYLASRGFDKFPDGLKMGVVPFYKDMKKIGEYETLISLVQDWQGNGITYHLTYTENGKKADIEPCRKLMKPKTTVNGGAIRLHTDFEDSICIAEGIESAYGAHVNCGLPAFAAMNAGCLEKFVPPEKVKTVLIYADYDASYAGQAAAYNCAKRLKSKGLDTFVIIPDKIGQDWNDVLLEDQRRMNGI